MTVVFAYIPVIHKQVLTFLKNHKTTPLWLLDNEAAANEYVYLERDARALPAQTVKVELAAHGFTDVTIITPTELGKRASEVTEFVIPEDEALRFFLDKYAPNTKATAENIFIRWTQQLSTTEYEVPKDRVITKDEFAQKIIKDLEVEADKSSDWWRQIAAAVVKGGQVIAQAHNHHLPTEHSHTINGDPRSNLDAGQGPGIYTAIHAEASVIGHCTKVGQATDGADIYVTTFPCPTCARLIIEAGFKRVFYQKGYSVLDAEEILKSAGVEIILVQG